MYAEKYLLGDGSYFYASGSDLIKATSTTRSALF